ncbi:MAG: hypothetical protein HJJLKODD_02063 [Phycisphaerae bacterium]|nr:hypothetical protein [Phycisphaerae bacterium]
MNRFTLAMIIGGGALIYFGIQESRLSSAAGKTPQTMTCQELSDKGPGENAHVIMTDFLLWDEQFVYESKSSSSSSSWTNVWVPAIPLNGDFHKKLLSMIGEDGELTGSLPEPPIQVIVKSGKISNDAGLMLLGEQPTIQGMVVNEIESLDSKERRLLEESYPHVNFDRCWILHHGRQPSGSGKLVGMIGGGLALAGVGIVMMIRARAGA